MVFYKVVEMSHSEYNTLTSESSKFKGQALKQTSYPNVPNVNDLPEEVRQEEIEERYERFLSLIQRKYPDFTFLPLKELLPATEYVFTRERYIKINLNQYSRHGWELDKIRTSRGSLLDGFIIFHHD